MPPVLELPSSLPAPSITCCFPSRVAGPDPRYLIHPERGDALALYQGMGVVRVCQQVRAAAVGGAVTQLKFPGSVVVNQTAGDDIAGKRRRSTLCRSLGPSTH